MTKKGFWAKNVLTPLIWQTQYVHKVSSVKDGMTNSQEQTPSKVLFDKDIWYFQLQSDM